MCVRAAPSRGRGEAASICAEKRRYFSTGRHARCRLMAAATDLGGGGEGGGCRGGGGGRQGRGWWRQGWQRRRQRWVGGSRRKRWRGWRRWRWARRRTSDHRECPSSSPSLARGSTPASRASEGGRSARQHPQHHPYHQYRWTGVTRDQRSRRPASLACVTQQRALQSQRCRQCGAARGSDANLRAAARHDGAVAAHLLFGASALRTCTRRASHVFRVRPYMRSPPPCFARTRQKLRELDR